MLELAPQTEVIDYRKIDGEWYCFGQKLSEVNKNEPPEYLANLIQALEALENGQASQTLVVSDKYSLVNNFMKAPDGRIVNEAFSGSAELLNQLNIHNAQSTLTNGVLSISNQHIPQQAIEQIATRQGLTVQFYSTEIPSDASLPSIDRSQELSHAESTRNSVLELRPVTEKNPEVLATTEQDATTKYTTLKKENSATPNTVAKEKEQDTERQSKSDSTKNLDQRPVENEKPPEQRPSRQAEENLPSPLLPTPSEIKEQRYNTPISTLHTEINSQERVTQQAVTIPSPQPTESTNKTVTAPIPVENHQEHLVVNPTTPISNLAEPKIKTEIFPRETRDSEIAKSIPTASTPSTISSPIDTPTIRIHSQQESSEPHQKTGQVTRQVDLHLTPEPRAHKIEPERTEPIKMDRFKGIEKNEPPREQISREITNTLIPQEEIIAIKDEKSQAELAQPKDLKTPLLETRDGLRETITIINDQKDLNIPEQAKLGNQQGIELIATPDRKELDLTAEITETNKQPRLIAEQLELQHPQQTTSIPNLDSSRTDLDPTTTLNQLIQITALDPETTSDALELAHSQQIVSTPNLDYARTDLDPTTTLNQLIQITALDPETSSDVLELDHHQQIVSTPNLDPHRMDLELTNTLNRLIQITALDPEIISEIAGQETRRELAPQILELIKIIATDESPEAQDLIKILLVEFLRQDETLELSKDERPTNQLIQIIEEMPEKLFLESVSLIKEYFIQLATEQNELAELLIPEEVSKLTTIELQTDTELKSEEGNPLPTQLQVPEVVTQEGITIALSTEQNTREMIPVDSEPLAPIPPTFNELAILEEQILQTLLLLKEDPALAQLLAQELLPVNKLRDLPLEEQSKLLANSQLVLQELLLAIEITELIQKLPSDQIISPTSSIGIHKEYESVEVIELIGELQYLKKIFSEQPELLVKLELLSNKYSTNDLVKTIQNLDAQIKFLQDLLITTSETEKLLTPNALTEIRLKRILQLNLLRVLTKQDLWAEEQLVLFMQLLELLQNTIEDPDEELELGGSQSASNSIPRRIRKKLVRYLGKKLLLKASTQSLPTNNSPDTQRH